MLSAFVLAAAGAGLCLLATRFTRRLLWPALAAALVGGIGCCAFAYLLGGTAALKYLRFRLALPFGYAALGTAIPALLIAWARRSKAGESRSEEAITLERWRYKRRVRRLLYVGGAMLVLLVAGVTVFRIAMHRRVQKELAAIRAEGYPVTLDDLNAWYPELSAGQNAAIPYLKALALYVDAKGSLNLWEAGDPLPPERKKVLEAYIANNRETLNLLHQAAAMPACRFPVGFKKVCEDSGTPFGLMGWLPVSDEAFRHLYFCKLLQSEALLHADNGRATEAADAIVCMLGLGKTLANEPFMVTQDARILFQLFAAYHLQRTLSRTALSDADLARVDDMLKDAENWDAVTRALAATRCMGSAAFTNPKAGAAFAQLMDEGNLKSYNRRGSFELCNVLAVPTSWHLRFLGLLDADHLLYLRWTQRMLADWRARACKGGLFDRQGFWASQPNPFEHASAQALYCNFTLPFVIGMPNWPYNLSHLICQAELARAGIAVEHFRNVQGRLPDSLSALVPDYLPAVPIDPWDGKPVRYRKLAKGYAICSVGRDGKNDGETADPGKDFTTFRVAR